MFTLTPKQRYPKETCNTPKVTANWTQKMIQKERMRLNNE